MKIDSRIHPVIIIGGGPSGIAAAIQLKRSGIEPLIIEKDQCGGLLRNAFLVENYPGFYDGISGTKLSSYFEKHLDKLNIVPHYSNVRNISYSETEELFSIQTEDTLFKSKVVIIATGLIPKMPEIIPDLSLNSNKKIYYNIYDLNDPNRKNILIVGAGDAAFDYALSLALNNKVLIINRAEKIKALNLLQERVKNNKSIEYKNNTIISEKLAEKFDIIIFAIGRIADLSFISSQIMKKRLELETKKVLYFIGDIRNGNYRQASIAVGNGIEAAMEINNLLNN